MPVLDSLRKSLFGDAGDAQTYLCEECGGDFSVVGEEASSAECPFCGASNVRVRG